MIQMVTSGALVRCKNTQKLGIVMTKPKEKPMKMSPTVTALVMVVDVLWNDVGFELDVEVATLERIDRNIRRY